MLAAVDSLTDLCKNAKTASQAGDHWLRRTDHEKLLWVRCRAPPQPRPGVDSALPYTHIDLSQRGDRDRGTRVFKAHTSRPNDPNRCLATIHVSRDVGYHQAKGTSPSPTSEPSWVGECGGAEELCRTLLKARARRVRLCHVAARHDGRGTVRQRVGRPRRRRGARQLAVAELGATSVVC